jgi:hypothetical protein
MLNALLIAAMSFDDLLFTIIVAGFALAGAYIKAEYSLHLRSKAARRSNQLVLRDLHVARSSLEQNGISVQLRIVHDSLQQQKSLQQRRLKLA